MRYYSPFPDKQMRRGCFIVSDPGTLKKLVSDTIPFLAVSHCSKATHLCAVSLQLRFPSSTFTETTKDAHHLLSPPFSRIVPPKMHQLPLSKLILPVLLTLSITCPSASQEQCSSPTTVSVRVGYWLSHSNHYSPVSLINTSLYTHLYYYSLSIDETGSMVSLPPPDQITLLTTFSATLKSNNNSLKTLLSITTDNHRSDDSNTVFSLMAGDSNLRAAFINSTIQLARGNAFDGLDLAWRYPSSSPDIANLGTLLAEWRARINEEAQEQPSAQPLLLTATVYFSNHLFDSPSDDLYYPTSAISSNLDWANVVCFGYHKNSEVTAADAALYDKLSHFSTSYGITSWLDSGVPPCKLVIGLPLYGRSWFLKNKAKNGIGDPVVAAGPRQKLSNQTGIMAFFEIQELLKDTGTFPAYDDNTVSAYFNTGGLWINFDSLEVVEEKIKFAVRNGLLGYFIWPISFDESNQTVAREASELWVQIKASDSENGSEDALSPVELSPQEEAQTSSAGYSGMRPGIRKSTLPFAFLYFAVYCILPHHHLIVTNV